MVNLPRCHFFFNHTTCESTCDTQSSSAANQGDNTVSVAQIAQIYHDIIYKQYEIKYKQNYFVN